MANINQPVVGEDRKRNDHRVYARENAVDFGDDLNNDGIPDYMQ